ncbi:hypothetical protein [Vibrio salinus]|uniref:hypothetical protein n=1 Tax=Vibrio salinus TaxID=2899784 RepID=UPI001E39E3A6|nr:hypothetical protein [Vibrio salinus]MCE0494480.1 hypothetical protein [Vibrio salinus]
MKKAEKTPCLRDALSVSPEQRKQHNLPYTENGIVYKILDEDDIEKASDCLTTSYFNDPKTEIAAGTHHIGFQAYFDQFRPYFKGICLRSSCESKGPCLIAENESGDIVGVLITNQYEFRKHEFDLFSDIPVPPEYGAVTNMINRLVRETNEMFPELSTHKTLHLFMESVLPQYRHRDIGLNLGILCLERAIKSGYHYLVAEVSTKATQHMLKSLFDFQIAARIDYQSYCYKGERVFANLMNTENELRCRSFISMVKKL